MEKFNYLKTAEIVEELSNFVMQYKRNVSFEYSDILGMLNAFSHVFKNFDSSPRNNFICNINNELVEGLRYKNQIELLYWFFKEIFNYTKKIISKWNDEVFENLSFSRVGLKKIHIKHGCQYFSKSGLWTDYDNRYHLKKVEWTDDGWKQYFINQSKEYAFFGYVESSLCNNCLGLFTGNSFVAKRERKEIEKKIKYSNTQSF